MNSPWMEVYPAQEIVLARRDGNTCHDLLNNNTRPNSLMAFGRGSNLEDHASGCKCLITIRIRLRNPFQTMALKLMACNRWWVILTVLTSIRWTRPSSKWESKGTQPNATFTPRNSRPYLKGLLINHWFPLTYWGLSPPFRFPSDQVFEKKLTCSEETGSFSARCISKNPFKRVVLRLFQHTFGTHP